MVITAAEVIAVHLPLRTPFTVAYASFPAVASVLVRLTADDGVTGWGEGTPDPDVTGEDLDDVYDAVLAAAPALLGADPRDRAGLLGRLQPQLASRPTARAALDIALHDLLGRLHDLPVWALVGGRCRPELRISRVIGLDTPEVMAAQAARLVADGFGTLKLKLGVGGLDLDVDRVTAVRRAIGPEVRVKVDVNQGWHDATTSRAALSRLTGAGLALVEQPVAAADLAGLAEVARWTHTPVMADEAVCSAADMLRAARLGACDLVNVKLMKAGGLLRASEVCAVAQAAGISPQVGTMVESSVASAAGLHLAAALPGCAGVEMSGPLLLAEDLADVATWYRADRVRLPDRPGLGVQPYADVVDRYAVRRARVA